LALSTTTASHTWYPSLAYHYAGDEYLLVWENGDGNRSTVNNAFGIFGARVAADGTLLLEGGGTNFEVSQSYGNGGSFSTHLAPNNQDGQFLIVWDDYRNDQTNYTADIYARLYAPLDQAAPTGWTNFQPASGWQTTSPVNVSVQVTDAYKGLNGATAQVRTSTDGGGVWSGWQAASCSGCGAGPDNS
ncbi:MAG: hypothetical protein ACE5H9_21875, partial [Anaerolineae bacterium]